LGKKSRKPVKNGIKRHNFEKNQPISAKLGLADFILNKEGCNLTSLKSIIL
jgi:hypothetical protein